MPLKDFLFSDQPPDDWRTLLVNLGLVLFLGQVLVWHYQRFSPVLSNKHKTGRVFVFLAATTLLVIAVVQSSLALSLGLVGALSIIRFRTPIKEPEELAYLFLAIGLGLGLGANQRLITVLVFVVVLLYMGLMSAGPTHGLPSRVLVHVSGALPDAGAGPETTLRGLLRAAGEATTRADLRRVDVEGGTFSATLVLDLARADGVGPLLTKLAQVFPGSSVSVVEGSGLE